MIEQLAPIADAGITGAVIAYFMWRDWKIMGKISQTLAVVDRALESSISKIKK